jgi:mono/diheme cytochrome c family protein
VYRTSCLECHDNDGRGGISRDVLPKIPDFTDAKWQASRTDAELIHSILEGKGKSMPRMQHKLGKVEATLMVSFVRGFQGGKQVIDDKPDAAAARVQLAGAAHAAAARPQPPEHSAAAQVSQSHREAGRLFQRLCVMCHGSDGKGTNMRDNLPRIPDFSLSAWQDRRSDPQLIVSILDGKGTHMPSFRTKVAREQASELVALVRTFGPARQRPATNGIDDFEARMRQLSDELEKLREQSRALSNSTRESASKQATNTP